MALFRKLGFLAGKIINDYINEADQKTQKIDDSWGACKRRGYWIIAIVQNDTDHTFSFDSDNFSGGRFYIRPAQRLEPGQTTTFTAGKPDGPAGFSLGLGYNVYLKTREMKKEYGRWGFGIYMENPEFKDLRVTGVEDFTVKDETELIAGWVNDREVQNNPASTMSWDDRLRDKELRAGIHVHINMQLEDGKVYIRFENDEERQARYAKEEEDRVRAEEDRIREEDRIDAATPLELDGDGNVLRDAVQERKKERERKAQETQKAQKAAVDSIFSVW
jgi:hypothetical protein